MKKIRKTLSIILALIMIASMLSVSASAAFGTTTSFKMNVYSNEKDSIDTVNWYEGKDGIYYMFLPADTDLASLTVWYEASDDVYVGGTKLVSGEKTDAFAQEGLYTLKVGIKRYSLYVMCSAELPAVYITTESGSLDYIHASKDNKEAGKIRIVEDGKVTVDKELKQIKGRGNATWDADKKPYNIKFDKKTDLFGMGKAKKWTLLASYYDLSLIRNNVAFRLADEIGLPNTSEVQAVDLYINGIYMGNYLVCESVEIGSERIDINDLENANEKANPDIDIEECSRGGTGAGGSVPSPNEPGSMMWVNIPNNPDNITGGYLLEFDFSIRYSTEISGFVTNQGQNVVIKSPEYASQAETEYISSFMREAEDALYSEDGYNALGKHYSEYFDMDSFVKMYILQEFTMNLDAGDSSCFFYKDADSDKLIAAPAWDFDHALGDSFNRFGVNIGNPYIWWANTVHYAPELGESENQIPTIFAIAYKHEDFRALVSEKWAENSDVFGSEKTLNQIDALAGMNSASAVMNAYRWDQFSDASGYGGKLDSYNESVKVIKNFITARIQALNKGFSDSCAMLYYDANGGTGNVFNNEIVLIGDSVTVKGTNVDESVITAPAGCVFAGWNTAKDGSGTSYSVGDSIKLNNKTTVLYAQWKDSGEDDECKCICRMNNDFARFLCRLYRLLCKLFGVEPKCKCS